ncbi:MAG: hypothetical protein V9G09_02745 [Candidatus Nanopelagicales bacterium]
MAENRPDRGFRGVEGGRAAQPGNAVDRQGRPQGVRDGDRVRIQVEHPAQAADGRREIAQVGQLPAPRGSDRRGL